MKKVIIFSLLSSLSLRIYPQCSIVDLNITSSTLCLDEPTTVSYSTPAENYVIDLCANDMQVTPELNSTHDISDVLSTPFGYELIQDEGNWYGFIINRSSQELIRLEFGSDPFSAPVRVNLGGFEGDLSSPEDLTIKKIENSWFAILTTSNGNPNNVIRLLDFGASITNNIPSISDLGNFGITTTIRGASFVYDGINIVLVIPNNKALVIVNFRDSFYNEILAEHVLITGNIANHTIFDLAIHKKCDQWFVVAPTLSRLNVIQFGTSLLNTSPTSTKHLFANPLISLNAFEIDVFDEGDSTYALVSNLSEPYQLIGLGDLNTDTPYLSNSLNNTFVSFSASYNNGGFVIQGIENDNLISIVYKNDCGESVLSTRIDSEIDVTYNISGTHHILLTEVDGNGGINTDYNTIIVSTDTAPSITTASQNICLSNPINFTSSSDQTLTSSAWNFGDTNTSTDPNPSHTYATAGEYEVVLDVESSNGCHNFIKQVVKVYNPPVPDFTLPSGSICTNEDYTFVNNTIDDFDGNLTYEWQVDGEAVSSDRELIYQFTNDGAKEIKLITSIPGCDIEQVQNIANVNLGATPFFSSDTNITCLGDPITFVNQSTGDGITDHSWDFGDGDTSSGTSPTHAFSSVGNFTVSLAVTNAAGCITTYEEVVQVHSLPVVDFESELACTDRTTQLSDLTTVANANIASWDWDFGDAASGEENISAEKDPIHTFSDAGDYTVSLSAISTFGCEASTERVVIAFESPTVDFDIESSCIGEAFNFTDTSIPSAGGSIISRSWNINGSIYTTQSPSHIFDTAGTYDVSLIVRSNNLCTITSYKTVIVNAFPIVDYSLSSNCVNTVTVLTDESTLTNDNIISWEWVIDGEDAGNTSNIEHVFTTSGSHQVQLRIITERGCIVTKNETIMINDLPAADFDPSPQYITSGSEVFFNNSSDNAVGYSWDFGDGSAASIIESPIHTYDQLGTYNVLLKTESAEGCFDEISKPVFVVDPMIDIRIDDITIFNEGRNVLFTMSNLGTIPVSALQARISINNSISVEESFELELLPGEIGVAKSLSFTIPEGGNIDFICIELTTDEGDDIDQSNNTRCISLTKEFLIMAPYPIPVTRDQSITVPIVGDTGDEVQFIIRDALGKQFISENITLTEKGVINFEISLDTLKPGIYFLQVQATHTSESFRIFVN